MFNRKCCKKISNKDEEEDEEEERESNLEVKFFGFKTFYYIVSIYIMRLGLFSPHQIICMLDMK